MIRIADQSHDFLAKQQDAYRRVMEMQRRNNARLQAAPLQESNHETASVQPQTPMPPTQPTLPSQQRISLPPVPTVVDSDVILLGALLFVLIREGADRTLIIALLYLLLF